MSSNHSRCQRCRRAGSKICYIQELLEHGLLCCGEARLSPQPIDVIEGWKLGFCLGNAIKYIARAGRKPGESRYTDLSKAFWRECPRRVMGLLHASGDYRHYHCNRRPGKVLCFCVSKAGWHREEASRLGLAPTPAQAAHDKQSNNGG